jgi:pyruvate formate lyase activating enzyme
LLATEPIEKRPLFHFLPGEDFLAVGLLGCSLACKFCQTFEISQSVQSETTHRSPRELIDLALSKQVSGIAFTFNEPTIHYEYIMEVANGVKNTDLKIVIKSNGFINKHILDDLDMATDAWNIDLKGDHIAYESICSGSIQPVLATVESLIGKGSHLEISYLVLPEQIDNMQHHTLMRDWLSNLSTSIPIHLIYFYPFYQKQEGRYNPGQLLVIRDLFAQKLDYVYISNIFNSEIKYYRDTRCSVCDNVLISRQSGARIQQLDCCGVSLAGIFRK